MSKTRLVAATALTPIIFPHQHLQAVQPPSGEEFAAHCSDIRRTPDERMAPGTLAEYARLKTFAPRTTRARLDEGLERFGGSGSSPGR